MRQMTIGQARELVRAPIRRLLIFFIISILRSIFPHNFTSELFLSDLSIGQARELVRAPIRTSGLLIFFIISCFLSIS